MRRNRCRHEPERLTGFAGIRSGGQWVLLGSYAFTAGTAGSVTLTDNANGTVIADAIKLVATSGGTPQEALRSIHTDHLNTPRLVTNASGAIVWRWEGKAFGDTAPNEDADGDTVKTTINLRYPGQYVDAESELFYNWNRYYEPRTGRYVTSVPIGLDGGLNTFSYVMSNPLRFVDPTGLELVCRYVIGGYYNKTIDELVQPELGYWKTICIAIPKPGIGIPDPNPRGRGVPIPFDFNFEMDCSRRTWIRTQEEVHRRRTERWMYHWEECKDTCTGESFKIYLPDKRVD